MLIYIVTCRVNGKVYIGKWHGKSAQQRWKIHLAHAASGASGANHFYAAIRKYGPEAFHVGEICHAALAEELIELEKFHIARLRSHLSDFGYNMTLGGEGAPANAELRKRMSEARRGRKLSPQTVEKIRAGKIGSLNPFFGKTHSEENREKMGAASRGKPVSEATRRKRSAALSGSRNPMYGKQPRLGKHHSARTKQDLSEHAKGRWTNARAKAALLEQLAQAREARKMAERKGGARPGEQNHMFGKNHSEETRRKISERAKARNQSGENNPMYGVASPMKGKRHTPEALAKIRAAKRAYWERRRQLAK